MNRHRPAPGIGRGPQHFSAAASPPIKSPLPPIQAPCQEEGGRDLAEEIYCRLATEAILCGRDLSQLASLAQQAIEAARVFQQQENRNA